MKTLTILFAFLFAFSFVSAQSQVTTIKSFQVVDINSNLELAFPTDSLEIVEWDEKVIRLEITISANVSEDLLKRLVTVSRYELSLIDNSFLMTNVAKTVFVKGVEVKETFKVKVSVPRGFRFQVFPSLANR